MVDKIYLCDLERDEKNPKWVRACAYGSMSAMKEARNVTSMHGKYLTIVMRFLPVEEVPDNTYCFVLDGEGNTHYKMFKDFNEQDASVILIKRTTLFVLGTMGTHNRAALLKMLLDDKTNI